jgi:DNA-binding NtrC family response regulator
MSAFTPNSVSMSSAEARPLIGIVDDGPITGESLVQRLQLEGYCDIRLPDLDGEQLFRRALPNLGATPVIFITAFGEIEQAVRLMQAGADDYVTKPFEIEVLLHKIAALCAREVVAGNGNPGRETLGASAAMLVVESELLRVTDAASPVLLLGETGVGKGVVARPCTMHRRVANYPSSLSVARRSRLTEQKAKCSATNAAV